MRIEEPPEPYTPKESGIPGWVIAIVGLLVVAVILIVLLVLGAGEDTNVSGSSGKYEEVDIVCYEDYSYIHNLGPTPLTLQGKPDPTC